MTGDRAGNRLRCRLRAACALQAAAVLAIASGGQARASPGQVLRFATIAPDGTEWARLTKSFAREIEQSTEGAVQVKWYLGGIAGDEVTMIERIRRGQLDGAASGGMTCQRLAPSLRVLRLVGLFQSREEALHVVGRLKPRLDKEFAARNFVNLGEAGFGSDIIYSREPVRSFDDLKGTRFWVWDLDDVWRSEMVAMGINVAPLPVSDAATAYEDGTVDGFLAIATAALAYQWSTRARYFTDLHLGYLMGCLIVSEASFDPLPTAYKDVVRAAAAKLMRQMEDTGVRQDAALLGGLFEKQGLRRVPVSPHFRAEFLEAASKARASLGSALTSPELLNEIMGWLADYRSEHQP